MTPRVSCDFCFDSFVGVGFCFCFRGSYLSTSFFTLMPAFSLSLEFFFPLLSRSPFSPLGAYPSLLVSLLLPRILFSHLEVPLPSFLPSSFPNRAETNIKIFALGNGTDTPGMNQKLLPWLNARKGSRFGVISESSLPS